MNPQAGPPAFTAQICHVDGQTEIALAGELDIATVGILQQVLDDLLAHGHSDLRLTASALTFLGAEGIGCLLHARKRAEHYGGNLRLESLNGPPLRVLTLCDLLAGFTAITEGSLT